MIISMEYFRKLEERGVVGTVEAFYSYCADKTYIKVERLDKNRFDLVEFGYGNHKENAFDFLINEGLMRESEDIAYYRISYEAFISAAGKAVVEGGSDE